MKTRPERLGLLVMLNAVQSTALKGKNAVQTPSNSIFSWQCRAKHSIMLMPSWASEWGWRVGLGLPWISNCGIFPVFEFWHFPKFLIYLEQILFSYSFEWVKWNFTSVSPLEKLNYATTRKTHCCPPGKFLHTPMTAMWTTERWCFNESVPLA